jgi:hypothetical protein
MNWIDTDYMCARDMRMGHSRTKWHQGGERRVLYLRGALLRGHEEVTGQGAQSGAIHTGNCVTAVIERFCSEVTRRLLARVLDLVLFTLGIV